MENTSASLSESTRLIFLKPDEVRSLSFPAGRFGTVFRAGQPAENVYLVGSGLIKLHKYKGPKESKAATVDLASEGEFFGEEALSKGATYSFSAKVLPMGASISRIPRAVFLQTCEQHPGLWRAVAESTLAKTRRLQRRVSSRGLDDMERRILEILGEFTARGGVAQGVQQTIPLSQSELAELVGSTREPTTALLNRMERRDLVRLGRRQMRLVLDKHLPLPVSFRASPYPALASPVEAD
jgi:CRP/FNR family transcriptional regulator